LPRARGVGGAWPIVSVLWASLLERGADRFVCALREHFRGAFSSQGSESESSQVTELRHADIPTIRGRVPAAVVGGDGGIHLLAHYARRVRAGVHGGGRAAAYAHAGRTAGCGSAAAPRARPGSVHRLVALRRGLLRQRRVRRVHRLPPKHILDRWRHFGWWLLIRFVDAERPLGRLLLHVVRCGRRHGRFHQNKSVNRKRHVRARPLRAGGRCARPSRYAGLAVFSYT
jgi:hypothetical protein